MPTCRHESLEYVGEQKTDDGVNSYRRCRNCGMLLIMTPGGKLIGVRGVSPSQSDPATKNGRS